MENRLRLIRKELEMTQEMLAQYFGIGKSALSMIETGRAALSERNKNILIQELNVNPDWIDSGKGEMFSAPPRIRRSSLCSEATVPLQSVPLYNIEDSSGLVHLFSDSSSYTPIDFIHIPNLPKCDGSIHVIGDSMYPLLKSGDIVLYRQLNDTQDILWGDMYLLSIDINGDEYITVKYIQKSDKAGFVKISGYNNHHADQDIHISRIRAIALVKASIRLNSIK